MARDMANNMETNLPGDMRAARAAPARRARTLAAVAATLLLASAVARSAGPAGDLLVFDTRQDFVDTSTVLLGGLDAEGALRLEDFSDNFLQFLPPMEFAACTEPVSSDSSDACFAPGVLEPGFSLTSHNRFGIIMLGADLLGTTDPVIGGWPYRLTPSSLNYTQVNFTNGPALVGVDVYGFRIAGGAATGEPAPVLVEAFDTEGVLVGEFTVSPPAHNQPAFAGFFSPRPLGMVQIGTRETAAGSMISNLQFGGSAGRLQPEPALLQMGSVAIGASTSATLQLRNQGLLDVQVASVQPLPAPFAIGAENCTGNVLAAGDSCTIAVGFAPTFAGGFNASIEVLDAAGATTTVAVRGGSIAAGGGQ